MTLRSRMNQILTRDSFDLDDVKDLMNGVMKCPRCGTEMRNVGSGVGCLNLSGYSVVPPILVFECPQCGYSERSWAC